MESTTCYQFDAHCWFVCEATAFACQLEPGVFHLPAGCVFEAPPEAGPGQRARWIGGMWCLEAWVPPPAPDPVALLAAFLAANPSVAALVQGTSTSN